MWQEQASQQYALAVLQALTPVQLGLALCQHVNAAQRGRFLLQLGQTALQSVLSALQGSMQTAQGRLCVQIVMQVHMLQFLVQSNALHATSTLMPLPLV